VNDSSELSNESVHPTAANARRRVTLEPFGGVA
jgi:hypothetical protein